MAFRNFLNKADLFIENLLEQPSRAEYEAEYERRRQARESAAAASSSSSSLKANETYVKKVNDFSSRLERLQESVDNEDKNQAVQHLQDSFTELRNKINDPNSQDTILKDILTLETNLKTLEEDNPQREVITILSHTSDENNGSSIRNQKTKSGLSLWSLFPFCNPSSADKEEASQELLQEYRR